MQEILIEKIRTDGGVQSRERISDDYVMELAELIKAGKKLPPIDVYSDGTEIWAADGFHRILAHIKVDKRTVRCNVHKCPNMSWVGGRSSACQRLRRICGVPRFRREPRCCGRWTDPNAQPTGNEAANPDGLIGGL